MPLDFIVHTLVFKVLLVIMGKSKPHHQFTPVTALTRLTFGGAFLGLGSGFGGAGFCKREKTPQVIEIILREKYYF